MTQIFTDEWGSVTCVLSVLICEICGQKSAFVQRAFAVSDMGSSGESVTLAAGSNASVLCAACGGIRGVGSQQNHGRTGMSNVHVRDGGMSGDVHYEEIYPRVTCHRMWGMEPLVSFIRLRFEKSSYSLLQRVARAGPEWMWSR